MSDDPNLPHAAAVGDDDRPSAIADLLAGAVWFVVAIAIAIAAWRMDRLEHLQVSIYSAPGLVPGILGLSIAFMALLLMVRAIRGGAFRQLGLPRLRLADHWRLGLTLFLCLVFSVGLIGRGLPFWLAAAIFVSTFIFVFQFEDRRDDGTLLRGGAIAIANGLISGLAIHYLFQDLFLVRLP